MSKSEKTYVERVHAVTREIPFGRVSTYGHIASFLELGSARMVGWALNRSFGTENAVPAHRVVNRKGELSGRIHFPTPTMMMELLEQESVQIEDWAVLNFEELLWRPIKHLDPSLY